MPAERGVLVPYLRAWRLRATLKQEELAERSGVSRPTVQRGERGETISIDNTRKLAAALGITVEQLRFTNPDESDPKAAPGEAA
jgi:transcriptional regulator with XRE-family HTH domain